MASLKDTTLDYRRMLEGGYEKDDNWRPGDLELVLRTYGIFRDRAWLDPARLRHLGDEGQATRVRLEAAIRSLIPTLPKSAKRSENEELQEATKLYLQEAAYTWFNRLVALRCLEVRVPGVDEAIKVKPDYAGRSLRHDRFYRQHPELCQGEDEGLVAFLREACREVARDLPLLFDPNSPLTILAPSAGALQACMRALSGETVAMPGWPGRSIEGWPEETFRAPDLLGWIYQYWNADEKDRVFAEARAKKIEGPDIIPATCIYTEEYMVRFLVENSLGRQWVEMHPDSALPDKWEYFVPDAERRTRPTTPVADLTILDPACGSGHFLVYAFDLLWDMYQEEGRITDPVEVCQSILGRNLYGVDIDERSVQIAAVALYLTAKVRAPEFAPRRMNFVAANASVPPDAVKRYLRTHPEDEPLRGVLSAIFEGLENVAEIGSLLQVEQQLDRALEEARRTEARRGGERQSSMLPLLGIAPRPEQGHLDLETLPAWDAWKGAVLERLRAHVEAEAETTDFSTKLFGAKAERGLDLIELLAQRYDIVVANPPYMGSKNMGPRLKAYVQRWYPEGRRDLYAAFIRRCVQLATSGGRVAMVTQQSWMFLRSYADLRAADDDRLRKNPRTFRGLLRETTIETLAHLGPRAFGEISGEVVNTVMFVLGNLAPKPDHRLTAFRLVGPKSPGEKDALLRDAIASTRVEDPTQLVEAGR